MKRVGILAWAIVLAVLVIALPARADGSLAQTFKRVSNAVVVVRTSERVISRQQGGAVATSMNGVGSGVVINAAGQVVTAAHAHVPRLSPCWRCAIACGSSILLPKTNLRRASFPSDAIALSLS